ncbi:hypothetical protein HanIR_Chr13g0664441 [Helianthus annuus]|nr:hypothetical protein HanIR_Chr13g0664441 [Helianthus annuus]
MMSWSNDFPPLEPPSRLSIGPTGYTGGMLTSADNDSIACVSNSKNVLTMIALTSLSFRTDLKTKSSPSLVWTRHQKALVGNGFTKLGTEISVSEFPSSITSLFISSLSVWI